MWTLTGFADEISDDLGEQCSTLTALGMSHLEFRGAWGTNVADLTEEQVARAAQTMADAGIAVSSIGSPVGKVPVTADLADHLARLDRCIDLARRFGAPYIRIFSFYPEPGRPVEASREAVLSRVATLVDRVAGTGLTLLHENEKGIYGDTPQRCRDILSSVDSPALRAAWDPANFVQVGIDRPFDVGFELLRPWLAYVHVKDARAGTGEVVPAGQGDGQVGQTLAALRDDGFDGFFSLEPHLAHAGANGGFSGPELFTVAHRAFTGLLDGLSVAYR